MGRGKNQHPKSVNGFVSTQFQRNGDASEWGRYCFHRCVSVHIKGGGFTPSFPTGGSTVILPDWGYPHPRLGQGAGYPHPRSGRGHTPDQNSTACTCYAAGGMPLAFTQDFLVCY